ncbi:MAG: amino acid adenylation domain-containing protein [Ardenticatenaceae bacterium]
MINLENLQIPISYGQEALFFMHKNANCSSHVAIGLHLQSIVDPTLLRDLFGKLMRRHPALRTTFAINEGQPVQVIHPAAVPQTACFQFEYIDGFGQSMSRGTPDWEQVMQAAHQAYQHPFDLQQGPLWRVSLITQSPESHLLLMTFHHIISDGWSYWMLLDELLSLYAACASGNASLASTLPPLKGTYPQFVHWEREKLAKKGEQLRSYWLESLSRVQRDGELPSLDLPTDYPRPAVPTYQSGDCALNISSRLRDELRALARREGVSFYTVLLAAFALLLARLSGQEQILVGVPTAGRSEKAFQNVFGYFVNEVVVQATLENVPFTTFLSQVRAELLGAIKHRDYPFSWLVKELQSERDTSRAPLFQAAFVLQKGLEVGEETLRLLKGEQIQVADLRLSFTGLMQTVGNLDLMLDLIEQNEGLVGYLRYNRDIFDSDSIERMATHFQTLLEGIVAHPETPIAFFSLLTESQKHQLLVEWNETAADYPSPPELGGIKGGACIHQLFEQQVTRTPEAIAVIFPPIPPRIGGEQGGAGEQGAAQAVTYHELNTRANQLAHYLVKQGVGPDVLVGICLPRSIEMVVGLLAILKAGGAYLPLDPSLPDERLRYMLSDSGVKLLLTENKLASSTFPERVCGPPGIKMVNLDQAWAMWGPDSVPMTNVKANHLAYCIYTSGSTGKPKGVLVEHKSLVCRAIALKEAYSLSSRDRVLQFAGISFDVMAEELFPALLSGATVVLRPPSLTDWESWERWLAKMKLTVLNLPAPYWHEWVQELTTLPPDLRLVVVGSDKVLPSRLAKWQELSRCVLSPRRSEQVNIEFLHAYGITEDTITTTLYKPSHDSGSFANSVPIGRPLPNTQLYILDRYQNPVPIGVPGELHIGGAGLARGYLNRPQLTKEKFIPNPFWGAKLYKTGDLCRYLPDGNVEFLGRADDQVKIRGFRIELGEIESNLRQCVGVREAVVVVVDSPSGKQLVAYVVGEAQERGSEGACGIGGDESLPAKPLAPHKATRLRAQLTHSLPSYMIPSAFVQLDALPLTPNGKVDRKGLAACYTSVKKGQADFVEARTAREAELAHIWRQLLQLERVSIHDNFFTVGGDSILSLQLVSRCRARGIQITPQQIFQHQTIAELADAVQSRPMYSTNDAPDASLTPWTLDAQALVTGDAPLTAIQYGWAALNLPNPHIYNQSILIEIDSAVDSALLRRAVQILLRHHDALRLRYQETKAGWRQSFSPPTCPFLAPSGAKKGLEVLLWEVDVSGLSTSAVQEKALLITSRIERSFNLTNGPVMGLALLRRADGPSQLLWIIHHLVVDWVSWRILLADLSTVYQQLAHEQPVQLPAKTTSFQRWTRWLHDRGASLFAHELDYWRERFSGGQPLPQDHPDGVPTWASICAVHASLTVAETQALLHSAPAAYTTQINDLLLTALLKTIVEWTEQAVMLIELESHGRQPIANSGLDEEEIDLSRTVGWFTTAFPVRLAYHSGDLGDLILSVKEQLRQIPNHGLGYGVLRYIQQRPELMPFSMPPICFNYLGQFETPTANGALNHPDGALLRDTGMDGWQDMNSTEFLKQNGPAHFWNLFSLELMVMAGELRVDWLYSENVHERDTVERLTERFMINLRHLITHCQQQTRLQSPFLG